MIAARKWIERSFEFDAPVWMFPNILERLRGTPARVEDRIASLPADILTKRPAQGWSIQEQVGHLWSVESTFHGRLDDFDAGQSGLRPADMENRRVTAANYNDRPLSIVLQGFREERSRLIARLEVMDEAAIQRTAMHPRLQKPMRVLDMMFFAAEHDDHHLAKITELYRAFTSSE